MSKAYTGDYKALLKANGWDHVVYADGTSKWVHPFASICDEMMQKLADLFYNQGHHDGFQRGAYEAETKEDV